MSRSLNLVFSWLSFFLDWSRDGVRQEIVVFVGFKLLLDELSLLEHDRVKDVVGLSHINHAHSLLLVD